MGYTGGVTLFSLGVAARFLWPRRIRASEAAAPGFMKTMMRQMSWMLVLGIPLVGMIHIALGSFLSLQAYYGSTFVDGTGAVVGVGLLRNLGGLMTGLTFSGILAVRMIPELRILARCLSSRGNPDVGSAASRRMVGSSGEVRGEPVTINVSGLAAPRIVAAGIACLLLSQWGITVGTTVGWLASQSMMGLSSATFFMMLLKMMWFRDVVGLIIKGLIFGALPAAICCYEGLALRARDESSSTAPGAEHLADACDWPPPWVTPVFRATCISFIAILLLSSSWFILVYHAVPFYGPTLLPMP
jgi:phospholipid/cholesterol/gamma-HCH transport system permease protein